jgi:hypothetical protein
VSRFELRRILGVGGMGAVYEAHDRSRDRLVAVKTLQAFDPYQLFCLKNEFRALADVVHPNLVALFELVQEGTDWWLVMERVHGQSVDKWVRVEVEPSAGALISGASASRVRESFAQIAEGLRALHRAGKLHRDLKPSNVLVDEAGRAVLLDFGLVVDRASNAEPQLTRRAGTAEYLSPERLRGEPALEASDWYALGVMLYEALTGLLPRSPRRSPTPLRAPHAVDPAVPRDLSELCVGLLADEPEQRPTGAEVAWRLRGKSSAGSPLPGDLDHLLLGRDHELAQLERAFAAAGAGALRVLSIEGESGMGKTALLDAFCARLAGRANVLRSRCLVAETSPYKGVDGLIDGLTSLLLQLHESAVHLMLSVGIADLSAMFPVLRRLPVVDEAHQAQPRIEEPMHKRRRRAVQALIALCRGLAQERPLVLCIDDVQWGDEDAAHLLLDLFSPADGSSPLQRTLLVLLGHPGSTAPPAPFAPLAQLPDHQTLRLGALAQDAAAELATTLLGDRPALAERVVKAAGGHPIIVRELAEHLGSQGSESELPETSDLAQLVQSRLGRLSAPERELVEIVSLMGRPVRIELLEELCAPGATADILSRALCARRFLKVQAGEPAPSYEMFHDQLRVHVLEATSPARQVNLHARVAAALAARADAEPELLSHHFEGAGELEQAALHAGRAGREALRSLAFGRAAAAFARALALHAHPAPEKRALLLDLAVSYEGQGLSQRAAEVWLSAVELAGSREEALTLESRAAEQWLLSGHVERGLNVLHRIASEVGVRIPNTRVTATLHIIFYRLLTALKMRAKRAREAPEPLLRLKADATFGISRALSLLDMDFGVALHARSLLYALQSGDALRIALGLAWDASFRGALGGDRDPGFSYSIARAESLALSLGDGTAVAWCALARGTTVVLSGKYQEGLVQLERAHALFVKQPRGVAWELTMTRVVQAAALAWSGELRALNTNVTEWLREAEERGDAYAAMVLRMRASNGIRRLARAEPRELLAEVDDQLARWPRHPMVEDLSLRYGQLLRAFACVALGEPEQADAHLAALRRNPARFFVYMPRALRAEHDVVHGLVALAVERPRLAEVARYVRNLRADPRPYGRALGDLLAASAALRTGDSAESALRRAEQSCDAAGMRALAESARWQRAALLDGAAGLELRRTSQAWFDAQEVVSAEHFVKFMLLPWSLAARRQAEPARPLESAHI